jgi:Fe-Mn family superoxide dismutase
MAITLPDLPYALDALEPHISRETLEFHYGKHHASYVAKLNPLVKGTELADADLETIVRNSSDGIFNNAAQVWNHSFYWNCLSPNGGGAADGAVAAAINTAFGSFDKFKDEFATNAVNNFGSGWTWLIKNADGSVGILNTSNASTPLTDSSVTALLTVDVSEHAYYIDYRNARPAYMEAFWKLVNWDFVNANFGA